MKYLALLFLFGCMSSNHTKECKNNYKFIFNDYVIITKGFYRGQKGDIVHQYADDLCGIKYDVFTGVGMLEVNETDMEKRNNK